MNAIFHDFYPNFLYVDKYTFSNKWIYPYSDIPYAILRYVVSGNANFELNGVDYSVKADDVFYIPQGSKLSCTAKNEICFISIRLVGSMQLTKSDLFTELWNFPIQANFANLPSMKNYFEQIYASAVSHTNYKMLTIRGYLNLICSALAQYSEKDSTSIGVKEYFDENNGMNFEIQSLQYRALKSERKNDPRITAVMEYITAHPNANLTREQLCKMAEVSESTLRRLFKEQTGKTIYEHITETKMNNAARRLLIAQETVAEIAYDLGFESPSYFTKCFKANFGVSPKEYRRLSHET